jgi:pepF/M3 family oligoendopeptidase
MNMNWDLERIYSSIDSQKFNSDFDKLSKHIASVSKWCDENFNNNDKSANKIEAFLKLNNEYRNLYLKLYCYTYLLISVDNEDDEAMNMINELDVKNDEFMNICVTFTKWLKDINNLEEIIESSKYLSEHKFYLNEIFLKSKYMLSKNEEQLINKMQRTGSRAWQRLYTETLSDINIKIKIDGKLKNMSFGELKNMGYQKDSNLRKLASKAEKKACKNISKTISSCINELSGEAITICDMKGYDSVLHKVLVDARMDYETLNTMIKVIEENLCIFHKYYKTKAKILGTGNKINFCDVYAPISTANGKISYKDSQNLIISSFKNFSDNLGDFAKKAFDEKWIDAEPSSKKSNYAISVDIFPIKESRIMTNFSGNYIDTSILAHEIGHAYHSYCLKAEELLNTDYPIPIAETASIFCETIINNELINNVEAEDKITILERHISDVAYYIVEMYGRFLFECELFKKRKSRILSVEELNQIMGKSMEKVYGNTINKNTINEYAWVNNAGFYMAGSEFLNFPYTFGVLFSKGLYAEYLKNKKDFVRDYKKFLKLTSTNNIYDVAKFMNIDIHSREFWEGAVKIIEIYIEEFIKEVDK